MKMLATMVTALILATGMGAAAPAFGAQVTEEQAADSLPETIAALDAAVFEAFNNCSSPAQLREHANYFSPEVEFYHDTGGVTWSRQEMLANTEKYACGNFRRELVAGTLEVFPIKGFGAIAMGTHRFCQFATGECDGIADFTMVWRKLDDGWIITRVLSYGHRPVK